MVADSEVIEIVRKRLGELGREKSGAIELMDEEFRREDDWLYLIVKPPSQGFRASDYAFIMARVERELRDEGIENVLLVPASPEV